MATQEQQQAYHAQCSAVDFGDFDVDRSYEYDPADEEYYDDVAEHGRAGGLTAVICLGVFLGLLLFSIVICCIPHRWVENMNFLGMARKGKFCWHRLIGSVFVSLLLICALLISAMSVWGIAEVERDAKDVVPKAFDFIEDADNRLDSIYKNLTSAVSDGELLVNTIRRALTEIRSDPMTESLAGSDGSANETIVEVLTQLEDATDRGDKALDTVDAEINDNLAEVLDALDDAIGYRDEAEGINYAGRMAINAAFAVFIVFGLISVAFSAFGVSPRCVLAWAILMWSMLFVAFTLVAVADVAKEFSKETCLYIDTYAATELKQEVKSNPQRAERLFWYYFQPPGENKLPVDELEDLWGFPLTDILTYFDLAESILFDGDQLRSPYDQTRNKTQSELFEVRSLLPKARSDIGYVKGLIEGDVLNDLHKDFKDIICCTEYESLEDVWQAWVVSSVFGLLIAVLMTLQACFSFRCGKPPLDGPTYVGRVQTQKTSAYMGPPVHEGEFASYVEMAERNESGSPLTNANNSSGAVAYPKVRMPPAYFEMTLRDR